MFNMARVWRFALMIIVSNKASDASNARARASWGCLHHQLGLPSLSAQSYLPHQPGLPLPSPSSAGAASTILPDSKTFPYYFSAASSAFHDSGSLRHRTQSAYFLFLESSLFACQAQLMSLFRGTFNNQASFQDKIGGLKAPHLLHLISPLLPSSISFTSVFAALLARKVGSVLILFRNPWWLVICYHRESKAEVMVLVMLSLHLPWLCIFTTTWECGWLKHRVRQENRSELSLSLLLRPSWLANPQLSLCGWED